MPSAEAIVNWLIEHQDLQTGEQCDTDSLSTSDSSTESDSMSEFDETEKFNVSTEYTEMVILRNLIQICS